MSQNASTTRPTTSPNAWTCLGLTLAAVVFVLGGAFAGVIAILMLGELLVVAALVTGIVALARREPHRLVGIGGIVVFVIMGVVAIHAL